MRAGRGMGEAGMNALSSHNGRYAAQRLPVGTAEQCRATVHVNRDLVLQRLAARVLISLRSRLGPDDKCGAVRAPGEADEPFQKRPQAILRGKIEVRSSDELDIDSEPI